MTFSELFDKMPEDVKESLRCAGRALMENSRKEREALAIKARIALFKELRHLPGSLNTDVSVILTLGRKPSDVGTGHMFESVKKRSDNHTVRLVSFRCRKKNGQGFSNNDLAIAHGVRLDDSRGEKCKSQTETPAS